MTALPDTVRPPDERSFLVVEELTAEFAVRRTGGGGRVVRAVDGVSFDVARHEVFGLVGETGAGKTTVGRVIAGLERAVSGSVWLEGEKLDYSARRAHRKYAGKLNMVFQDPYSSLDPRMRIGDVIGEPLAIRGGISRGERRARAAELLQLVGLDPQHAGKFPHECSGGQRQRVAIARALAVEPQLLILDEPVSALDLSIKAHITNLLVTVHESLGLTYVIISHDLRGMRHIADRVGVMYRGELVELGPSEEVYTAPLHHYTAELLEAVPTLGPARSRSRRSQQKPAGEPPPTEGCVYAGSCPAVQPKCLTHRPPPGQFPDGRTVRCHFPLSVLNARSSCHETSSSGG